MDYLTSTWECRVNMTATGRAAHSSYPGLGESAIEKLIDALVRLCAIELPSDPVMGRTHYTVGIISGGVAPNVVPAQAEAEITFRTIGGLDALRCSLRSLQPQVEIEEMLEVPPVTMRSVPGFETAVFPYTTDIPFLTNWGTPLLFGPGSVQVAHTDEERVEIDELHRAVEGYAALARHLLNK